MSKHFHRISMLILSAVIFCACTPTSTPTPDQNTTLPSPVAAGASPTMLATITKPLPTPIPSTEEPQVNLNQNNPNLMETNHMNITIGNTVLTATLVDNSSVEALKKELSNGPITINMRDYGSMEKVGPLGMDLPRNDTEITTEAGDIILYQGSALVIYYESNSWNFTRIGKINGVSAEELREILGAGDVTVTLSLSLE